MSNPDPYFAALFQPQDQSKPHEAFLYAQALVFDALTAISFLIMRGEIIGVTATLQIDERLVGTAAESVPIPAADMIKLNAEGEMSVLLRFYSGTFYEAYKDCGDYAHELLKARHSNNGDCQDYLQVRANAEKRREDSTKRIITPSRS